MGALVDAEVDGQSEATAAGDDIANQPDEAGVVLTTPLVPVSTATVDVTVSCDRHGFGTAARQTTRS